jgi:hypothetical protein
MSLTWGGVKQLVRLQAVAEQFADIAQGTEEPEMYRRASPGTGEFRDSGRGLRRVLDDLIDEVHGALRDADPGLADEFERIVIGTTTAPPLSLAARAAILTGWLEGAVEAETLEVQLRVGEGQPRARKVASRAAVAG